MSSDRAIRAQIQRRRAFGVWRHMPYLRRLADAPCVQADPVDAHRIELRGVVCGICAARTRTALESVPGVEEATVDLDRSEARIRVASGVHIDDQTLQRALEQVVVGMAARRWLERALRQASARLLRRDRRNP